MVITEEELPEPPGPTVGPQTVTPMKRVLEVMESRIPEIGDWTITDVAEQTLAYLEEFEPMVLRVWLRERGLSTLGEFLRSRQASQRTKWRRQAKSREFGESAAQFEADGNPSHMSIFNLTYTVSSDNIRRKMADMTGADHLFVSDAYAESADRQKMLAIFHKKIAEVVGDRRTADVIDEATLTEMYRSLTGG